MPLLYIKSLICKFPGLGVPLLFRSLRRIDHPAIWQITKIETIIELIPASMFYIILIINSFQRTSTIRTENGRNHHNSDKKPFKMAEFEG